MYVDRERERESERKRQATQEVCVRAREEGETKTGRKGDGGRETDELASHICV